MTNPVTLQEAPVALQEVKERAYFQEISLEEMDRFARTVWAIGRAEPACAWYAIASLIRNRAQAGARHRMAVGMIHPRFGGGSLDAACASALADLGRRDDPGTGDKSGHPDRPPRFSDSVFCGVFAASLQVWADHGADPVRGATLAHAHDQAPAWARGLEPAALIGSWFFYVEPGARKAAPAGIASDDRVRHSFIWSSAGSR